MTASRANWPQNIVAVPLMFAVLCTFDGLGYLFGPVKWSSTPTLDTFTQYPGGIRTYGAVLCAIGLTLFIGLGIRSFWAIRAGLTGVIAAYTVLSMSVLVAWFNVGIVSWGGLSKGFALATVAALILRRTPDRLGGGYG